VPRSVRTEAPESLLELTAAADLIAPAGLVPRDRNVDEPLKEIPLTLLAGPPGVLELLVRREVLPVADQLQAALEHGIRRHRTRVTTWLRSVRRLGRECYSRHVATILLAGVDLYFRGKLEGLLPRHRLVTADSVDPPDVVIADIGRIEPQEVADAYPDVPIVGFCNHTDTSGLRRAHAAGFDQVVVKAALVERVNDLVEELTASVD
jgi:hypothetical protein